MSTATVSAVTPAPFPMQSRFAERIGGARYGLGTEIYKFEKIKRAKAAARQAHPTVPLIDLGVGEPDAMAFPEVVEALSQGARNPANRGYADNGGTGFKEAVARYMQNVFGVSLDPATEVMHSLGSKAALSILPTAFINPGDYVLMTVPGYPVFGTHAKYLGGLVHNLPLRPENGYLPDLASVPAEILAKAKALVVNYPNNPTGASATLAFFAEAVDFCRRHGLLLIQDAAYGALVFEGEAPVSVLQVPGAKDLAVELHSLSKGFNMTGWRLGWVCGNAQIVRAYGDVKDNTDSGQFLAIQEAGCAAVGNPDITRQIAAKYSRRMDGLVEVLRGVGFDVRKPRAGFFLYGPAPKAVVLPSGERRALPKGEDFSQFLIMEALISTVPWDDVTPSVRFSVTFQAPTVDEEAAVLAEIRARLSRYRFEF